MKRKLINLMSSQWKFRGRFIVGMGVIVFVATGFGAARQDDVPVKTGESPEHYSTVKSQFFVKDDEKVSANIWYFTSTGERFLMDVAKNQVIRAEINGVSIPQGRIRFEDGRVILTDETGHEIQTFHLLSKGLNEKFMINFTSVSEQFSEVMYDGAWLSRFPENVMKGMRSFQRPKVMLGIHTEPTSPALEHHLNLEAGSTVMIAGLYEEFPAHQAGIQRYDILLSFDGHSPVTRASIFRVLRERDPGSEIELTVIQAGETKKLSITLEVFDFERMRHATLIGERSRRRFRGSLRPTLAGVIGSPNIVIAPDRSMFMFLQQEMNPHMNAEIHLLLKKLNRFERLRGMDVLPKLEIIIENEEPKPRESFLEPGE